MTEKIEAGTMVWTKMPSGKWNTKQNEYIRFSKGVHVIWSRDGKTPYGVDCELTTQNPTLPKTPEWMPIGCTLWEERGKHDNYVFYSDGEGSYRTKNLPEKRLHSFAVQAGDGTIELKKTPNWFTEDGEAHLYLTDQGGSIDAVVLGAVMRKATK